ncbi:MAG: methyltransferase domain-containing protein [Nitrospirae bacterium]|nr:methyltransferase domain-containing protein [Nitrospirota bacterium]
MEARKAPGRGGHDLKMQPTDVLSCKRCRNFLFLNVLAERNGAAVDGVLFCKDCGAQWALADSVIIDSYSATNERRVEEFNRQYGTKIVLDGRIGPYSKFVNETQIPKTQRWFTAPRKTAAFLYYCTALLFVWCYLLLKGRRKTGDRLPCSIINQLVEYYWYVPEMALFKGLELSAILGRPFGRKPGVVCDIGGGNGYVTDMLLRERPASYRINIDLFAAPSTSYDLILNQDIKACLLRDEVCDTVLSICVMEHIPGALSLFPSIYAKLRKGGSFFFTMPRTDYTHGLFLYTLLAPFSRRLAERYAAFDLKKAFHVSLHTGDDIKAALRGAGFKNIKACPFFSKKLLRLYDMINLPTKLSSHWYFWNELKSKGDAFPAVRRVFSRLLRSVLEGISALDGCDNEGCTHTLYICEK